MLTREEQKTYLRIREKIDKNTVSTQTDGNPVVVVVAPVRIKRLIEEVYDEDEDEYEYDDDESEGEGEEYDSESGEEQEEDYDEQPRLPACIEIPLLCHAFKKNGSEANGASRCVAF